MHIKAKDIDKFSAIKEVAYCVLCESLNNKLLPATGHWEKLSGLYTSWCLGCLSFLFSFIWGDLHVFAISAQISSFFLGPNPCLNTVKQLFLCSGRELCKGITCCYSPSHLPIQATILTLKDTNYQDLFYSTFHDI